MDVVNEILDAIEIIVDKKVRDTSAQIYSGVCKSVSGNTCVMSINGRNNTVQFYGSTPTVGSTYRVFVPNGNMSMAFIITGANDDSGGSSSGVTSYTKLTELPTINGVVLQEGATSKSLSLYGSGNEPNYPVTKVNGKTGEVTLTAGDVGADPSGSASAVLGTSSDTSDKNTVYGAKALAQSALNAANAAKSSADSKVASVSAGNNGISVGGTATAPTVGLKISSGSGNLAQIASDGLKVVAPEYSITKDATAQSGFLATYHLTKDNVKVGTAINIPKDYLVKSAEVKVATGSDASGFPAGTTYIDFVVNTYDTTSGSGTESHIYLNVETLVKTHTAGNGISISDTNVISAKVVAANGLSVDSNGIKMAVASTSANGAMTSSMVTKLNGIDTGATANTITLNGSATKTPSFYAPTGAGTSGQILVSSGSGAPTWKNAPASFHKYTATNGALTASGGAFTWSIPASTHKVSNVGIIVQLYQVSTGEMVFADVTVNQSNYNVTITINDTASAGTLASGTYRVVIFG